MQTDVDVHWREPRNWGAWGLYFAADDPRLWVPKREPGMGWTVNLAHPKGGPILISMLLAPAVLSMVVIALVHGTGAACG